jgi:hypothetical protein
MGVVQALFDFGAAHKLDIMRKRVLAFVPGDGNRPNTAAALCLQVPESWQIYRYLQTCGGYHACREPVHHALAPTGLQFVQQPPTHANSSKFSYTRILALPCRLLTPELSSDVAHCVVLLLSLSTLLLLSSLLFPSHQHRPRAQEI